MRYDPYHAGYAAFLGTIAMQNRADTAWLFTLRPDWPTRCDGDIHPDCAYCLDAPQDMPANSLGMAPRSGSIVHRWARYEGR